ncbi:MAG: anti-sigma factor [Actinobacteria bacterium]|nr:MAG: anti-sigma factor [Actinomycetota bacterium]
MRCGEARAEYLQGESSEEAGRHIDTCPHCRSILPQLEAMRTGLGDPVLWVEPPPELERAVVELVSRSGEPSAARRRRMLLPAAAVAAVAVLLGGAAWLAWREPAADWEVTMDGVAPGVPAAATVAGWRADTGTRLVMTAEGLGEAPPGHAYELWFSRGPVHVSAGTFTSLDEPVELMVGVLRSDYPRLWVTLEPIDDDPSPSPTVLFDVED